MIVLIPKILIRIKQERAWLRGFAAREGIDLVISDNRYGLVVPGVFCVFVTHQLRIRTPFGRWTDGLLQRMNYKLIGRFSRCWVPDIGGPGSLAGELSNPKRMPRVATRYIGVLSRLERPAATEGSYVLVILSGPEPQRTLLEKNILRQAGAAAESIVLVRGLPGGGETLNELPANVSVYDHLSSVELERMMAGARLVIARSGYSTVMDLARMCKRAVLIPTPGQTEQEYLGRYLAAKGWASCIPQNKFSLDAALRLVLPEPAWPADDSGERLRAEVLSVIAQSCPSALG